MAVKKIKFSPHKESLIASASYDRTTRVWDFQLLLKGLPPLLSTMQHHKEFVYGVDFNTHISNQLADCSWDKLIHIFPALMPSMPILPPYD